ncbi:MAG: hypothetical protein HC895_15545 [Leptolyngbyaceae cyanobacterium SM1_3_5]|nr:hypothetical protein [Leptolyngbyaceae cyanobacterium SM1_3_5]
MISAEETAVKLGVFTEACRTLQQRSQRFQKWHGAKLHPASGCYSPLSCAAWHFITPA